jgi:hypothetical protein
MGIVKIIQGDYNNAVQLIGNVDCNYNSGLAKMLAGNTDAAASQLKCAPENAQTYYLMAILGARTADTEMMTANLAKAIAADASYKNIALTDKEFIKYLKDESFLGALK